MTFDQRKLALQQKQKTNEKILLFVTQYQPSVPNLRQMVMSKWHSIQNQPLLRKIFKEPSLICYKKGHSLKDVFVRAKI